MSEKLENKTVEMVGFVVDTQSDLRDEIPELMAAITESAESDFQILSLAEWVELQLHRYGLERERDSIAQLWTRAYVESLCQRRREKASIDEPAD